MGIFKEREPEQVAVAGKALKCLVCGCIGKETTGSEGLPNIDMLLSKRQTLQPEP